MYQRNYECSRAGNFTHIADRSVRAPRITINISSQTKRNRDHGDSIFPVIRDRGEYRRDQYVGVHHERHILV